MNLDSDADIMNLDMNPANDPWRNGDTDAYLMNLGANDLSRDHKGRHWEEFQQANPNISTSTNFAEIWA